MPPPSAPPNRVRRGLLAGSALTALTAMLPACAPAPPLKLSTHPWPGHGFLWLAQQQGVLAAGGVRLVELGSASASLHALSAGVVDAATLTLDEVLRARAGGIPLSIVLVLDSSAGAPDQQRAIARWLGLSEQQAARALAGLKPCDLADNRRLLSGSPPPLAGVAAQLVLRLAADNIDARASGPTPLLDARFVSGYAA